MSDVVTTDRVRAAHERFITTGRLAGRAVRAIVADSWRRSARSGVDPEIPAVAVDMEGSALVDYRSSLKIAAALPAVRDLLVGREQPWVATITDTSGRLLWVEGDRDVARRLSPVGFVEGAVWSEESAGTNAPGIALVTGRAAQVVQTEHYTRTVQPWSCAAAPVRAPSGEVVGVLDVTGGDVVGSPVLMSLVRATAAAVEAQIARDEQTGPRRRPTSASRLRLLGGPPALVVDGRETRLSLRHAEILLLLSQRPAGLRADELAVLLSHQLLSDVTVRAEVSRLRRLVGPLLSDAAPYRLGAPLRTDLDVVRARLSSGDLGGALTAYPGPLLVRSEAPGVERLRDELAADVRASLLASAAPAVLSRWVARDDGADDWQAWERLVTLAPRGTPTRAQALGRLELLRSRLIR
ncbi:GAF domain-containing protein [Cellulomonas alba]|uniref:Transcriptional regulator n=1 Tax=Cellulomonas alba TaxID=3053467 RepID=A0ABT7SFC6_9CELL|nr:GAF domain-containing protein [Cellulomonas alba]MDM7854887.1 transcriptional regulator [Cellulomonas alba]